MLPSMEVEPMEPAEISPLFEPTPPRIEPVDEPSAWMLIFPIFPVASREPLVGRDIADERAVTA